MNAAGWTLDELTERVGQALARAACAGAYPGPPNGRVRQVPDRRAIRWYTTIGLVDRPLAMRGRTALYGPRHLRQLVAIKRCQADGLSLAEIQTRLVGADDAVLAEVAGLAVVGPADPDPGEPGSVGGAPVVTDGDGAGAPVVRADRRFWAERPAAPVPVPTGVPTGVPTSAPTSAPTGVPTGVPTGEPAPDHADTVTLLSGVALASGVTLLLPVAPTPTDLAAMLAAAQPLIDVLTARGLTGPADRRSL